MIHIDRKVIRRYEKGILVVQNMLGKIEWRLSREYDRDVMDKITGRIKATDSIERKLIRKNLALTVESAIEKLNDIGGVRCICPNIDDVYLIRKSIQEEKGIRIVKEKDFICHPKKSGYRSLHMILEVPIPTEDGVCYIKIELQIRTQSMHLWARLDHRKRYNKEGKTRKLTEKTDLTQI